jgi:1,4-dihydroxy-2-naphthoate octaprenyltransferase
VQLEDIQGLALAASVPVGFLATALLVINNLRDIPGDTLSGKRTLAVRLGDGRTRILYVALVVAAFVAIPFVAGLGERPAGALALIAVVLAQRPWGSCCQGAKGPDAHPGARRHRPRAARVRRALRPRPRPLGLTFPFFGDSPK